MTELFILFVVLNIVNVIIQTVKSLVTVKCGPLPAALINAAAYGFYTVVVVYTMCDLPLLWKAGVVATCNLIGVYIVKWGEAKARKDKLWKVEVTVDPAQAQQVIRVADDLDLSYNYVDINKYMLFNFYCPTQKESAKVRQMLELMCDVKYFVSESKNL